MSLNIQGSEFLSAREAGQIFSYSPDYISRLCRNGLVKAERVGKSWFVERESLKAFAMKSELEAEKRRQELREERISEIKDSITLGAVQSAGSAGPLGQYALQSARVAAFVLGVSVFLFFVSSPNSFGALLDGTKQFVLKVAELDIRLGNRIVSLWEDRDLIAGELAFDISDSVSNINLASAVSAVDSLSTSVRNTTENFSAGVPWYERAWRFITSLFETKKETVVHVPVKVSPPVVTRPATTTVVVREPVRVVERQTPTTVIENITRNVILSGVSQSELNALRAELLQRISQIPAPIISFSGPPASTPLSVQSFAPSQRIDNLANVTITNATITGGSVTATAFSGTLGIGSGGTGTSTAPAYGQVLLGNNSGGYDLVATSSLGISGGGSLTASSSLADFYDSINVGRTATTTIRGESNATSTFAGGVYAVGLQV
ncbi:helix-turn-helix domain-containing protein, partial [Patescibacteria group bacterium]|nr:helix-turn-helix domain-containing protein [Patescibacteria group bacterium]